MTSQYKQRLLVGEREIADKFKLLVEPRWKQYKTMEEQAVLLHKMGDLYLKAGVESKDGKDFTKASALLNAALVRTAKEEIQRKIKESLVAVRQEFMKAFYPDAQPILLEQWEERRLKNIHTLRKIRTGIEDNSQSLKTLMNRYNSKDENVSEIEKRIVKEAEKVSFDVQVEMLVIIMILWKQSIEMSNSSPPCKYSMIGLGSLARQEVTPYSDLEFAILVEEQSDDIQRYFENLTYLFHLSVLDLGETPLPTMTIASLNDFETPDGDWYYDKVTTSGFKLDGSMPWACKTPIGRQATSNNIELSFIKTPREMASLLEDDCVLGQSYRVAEVLSRTIHIIGDDDLYDIYQEEVSKIMEKLGSSEDYILHKKALQTMAGDLANLRFHDISLFYDNTKLHSYRLPSSFVEALRLCLTPLSPGGSQWCVIDDFVEIEQFSEKDAFELKVFIAMAYGLRLLTYFTNRRQHERVELRPNDAGPGWRNIWDKIKEFPKFTLHILVTSFLNEGFSSVFKDLLLEKSQIETLPNVDTNSDGFQSAQIEEIFAENKKSPKGHPYIIDSYYCHYFDLIAEDKGSRTRRCGENCQRNRVFDLECAEPNIEDFDFLLKSTDVCSCVTLVKTYIKVQKYCTQKYYEHPVGPPDAYMKHILDELSKCKELRDMHFLNFNLLKQACFCTDVAILKRVATSVEEFLNGVVPKMTENQIYKMIFNRMEFAFCQWLWYIYEFLGENEKLKNTLERWVNILEKAQPGGDFDIEYIGVYTELGKVLFQNSEEDEALYLYKKALQRLKEFVRSNPSKLGFKDHFFNKVVEIVRILIKAKRFDESEEILKEYILCQEKELNLTEEYILVALYELTRCYQSGQKYRQCYEVCVRIYHMVKNEGIGASLSPQERLSVAFNLLKSTEYGDIVDLLKTAEFHRLACNKQKDKQRAVLEHKMVLLRSSLQLFGLRYHLIGAHYVIRALHMRVDGSQNENFDFSRTDIWLKIWVDLCDAFNSFSSSFRLQMLSELYEDTWRGVAILSHVYNTDLKLYQIYVKYRQCYCLVTCAMNPDTSFFLKHKETAEYLYQIQIQLQQFFPQCCSAIKWCEEARLKLDPRAQSIKRQDYIPPSSLFNTTQVNADHARKLPSRILQGAFLFN